MRISWLYLVVISSVTLMTACGTDQPEGFQNQTDTVTPTNISYQDEIDQYKDIKFTRFDLDVDYVDSLSYRIEYEVDHQNKQLKASINDLDTQKVTGEEAFNQLSTQFQTFSFDANTPKNEVIREVIHTFELDRTFKEFELDITFADGTKREYEE